MKNNQSKSAVSPEMEEYLALCKRVWERMVETGEWPWEDDWRDAPDAPEY